MVIHPSFLSILGPNPSLNVIASSEVELGGDRRPFAHEAGVWIEATQEVWFTSNLLRDPHARNQISKIRLDGTEPVTSSWTNVSPIPDVVTGNGATLFGSQLLFCSQGVGLSNEIPSSLTLIDPLPPYSSIPLLNNFHGRPFNSINDVAVLPPPSSSLPHPTTNRSNLHHLPHSTIFFTDPTYAFAQGYKAPPELPNQVYAFDPTTGDVRVVADGFEMPNGICFDWEGEKCYITDTAVISAPVGPIAEDGSSGMRVDGARAGTMYVASPCLAQTALMRVTDTSTTSFVRLLGWTLLPQDRRCTTDACLRSRTPALQMGSRPTAKETSTLAAATASKCVLPSSLEPAHSLARRSGTRTAR